MSGSDDDSWSPCSSTSRSSSSRDNQTPRPRRNHEKNLRYNDTEVNIPPDFHPYSFPSHNIQTILFPSQRQVNYDRDPNGTAHDGSNWTNN